jgi:predicted nucleotidyltransferase
MNQIVPGNNVKAILLYGSQARGDADHISDVDVCVFLTDLPRPSEHVVRNLAPCLPDQPLSIVAYTERDLQAMLEHGSLFAWHLKLEARVVYGESYVRSKMKELQLFSRHNSEVKEYTGLLVDLIRDSCGCPVANEFDLSLLFTIVRNTCIVLSHWSGAPVFGRLSCFKDAAAYFPTLPFDESTYLELSNWKSTYERGAPPQERLPSQEGMDELIRATGRLLDFADEQTQKTSTAP